MEVSIDAAGRIVVPKALRDALGIRAGSRFAISLYGDGIHLVPKHDTARLVEIDGVLVADSDVEIDDADVASVIDALRR